MFVVKSVYGATVGSNTNTARALFLRISLYTRMAYLQSRIFNGGCRNGWECNGLLLLFVLDSDVGC